MSSSASILVFEAGSLTELAALRQLLSHAKGFSCFSTQSWITYFTVQAFYVGTELEFSSAACTAPTLHTETFP